MVQTHLNVGSRMIIGDYCLGSLNIGSVDSGEPDPGNVEFLRQVATQIAFAIDHVRAYEEINRLRDRLARENAYLLVGDSVGTSQKI